MTFLCILSSREVLTIPSPNLPPYTKDSSRSRILSYMHINKLAHSSAVKANKRCRTPGSETENSITHSTAGRMSTSMFTVNSLCPLLLTGEPRWMPVHARSHAIGEEAWDQTSVSFIIGSKQAYSLLWERQYLCFPRLFIKPTSSGRYLETKWVGASACKMCKTAKDSWIFSKYYMDLDNNGWTVCTAI